MELNEIAELFGLPGGLSFEEIKTGHINRTYLGSLGDEAYILQSVDAKVFPGIKELSGNIAKISRAFEGAGEERVAVPRFLEAGGRNYAEADGEIWRAYPYIRPTGAASANPDYSRGLAFGTFIRVLSERNVRLKPVGNAPRSFGAAFDRLTAAAGASGIRKIDGAVIAKLAETRDALSGAFTADFPKRIVHNDAKADNVIISDKLYVIDLDTAAPGYAATDYGDLVRSVCRGGAYSEAAVRDATRGFAEGLKGLLAPDEIDSLYYGVLYAVGELATRYLTDYASGEGYFKGKTPAERLARANELLGLLQSFMNYGDDVVDTIYAAFGYRN